jgi:hypothetical protein
VFGLRLRVSRQGQLAAIGVRLLIRQRGAHAPRLRGRCAVRGDL